MEVVIDAARGRVPIIAGTVSNAPSEAIDLTAHAKKAGATAALVVNPYYNRPTQEGLYRHFRAVAALVIRASCGRDQGSISAIAKIFASFRMAASDSSVFTSGCAGTKLILCLA